MGYTHASVTMDDGSVVNYNAHPFFHGASWYDWAYIHYVIEGDDGPIEQYYPSRILGFIEDDDGDEISAIVHCSERAVEWNELEEKLFVPFNLSTLAGDEQLVPLSSLLEPICVVPNYGQDDSYLMVLPKRQWSKYFTSLIREKNENL